MLSPSFAESWVIDNCTNIVEFLGNGTAGINSYLYPYFSKPNLVLTKQMSQQRTFLILWTLQPSSTTRNQVLRKIFTWIEVFTRKHFLNQFSQWKIFFTTSTGFQLLCPRDGKSASFNVTCKFIIRLSQKCSMSLALLCHKYSNAYSYIYLTPRSYTIHTQSHPTSIHNLFSSLKSPFGTGEACEVNRMFLSFESYSNLWYPLLLSLGLYCLLDGLLLF